MFYVYLIRSIKFSDKTYIGYTSNLKERLEKHNNSGSFHTSDFSPWELVSFVGFKDKCKALDFEKYIKVGSGHAFAKKRLR